MDKGTDRMSVPRELRESRKEKKNRQSESEINEERIKWKHFFLFVYKDNTHI